MKNDRMSECFREIFLLDGQPIPCRKFPNELVFSGRSIYEVVRLQDGIPVFLEDHMNRLERTALLSHTNLTFSLNDLVQQMNLLMKANKQKQGNIKIVVNDSGKIVPNHLMIYFLEHHYPTKNQYLQGVPAILYRAERELPTAKILNMKLRASIFKKLIDTHAYEALLVDNKGFIREGSRSNVFFILNKSLCTAPDGEVLPGIARSYILKICNNLNIPVQFKKIHVNNINKIQGAFISGTSPGVLGLSSIDTMKTNPMHKLIRKIRTVYFDTVEAYIKNTNFDKTIK